VVSGGVIVEPGAIIKDSVVMEDVVVKKGACIYTAIVDSDTVVEEGAIVGKENASREEIALIASGSVITK
jgi:glucose-1-phosphate adenylyltransferase